MKNASLLLIILCFYACSSATSNNSETTVLFAEDSNNWSELGDADWSFEQGELVGIGDSTAGFLISNQAYQDFELNLEFMPDSTINSGVFVRCEASPSAGDCYEINIWDLHPNQDYRTGAVVTLALPLAQVQSLNKWNSYKITCEGNRIQAWINGIQTVDLINEVHAGGKIALQTNGVGEMRFRNVMLKELD